MAAPFGFRNGLPQWSRQRDSYQRLTPDASGNAAAHPPSTAGKSGVRSWTTAFAWTNSHPCRGQGSELKIELPDGALDAGDVQNLVMRFHGQFASVYGRSNPRIPVEALNWQVRASGPRPEVTGHMTTQPQAQVPHRERRAFFPESAGYVGCPVVARADLAPGTRLDGPLLVEERESTTVVLPGCILEVREDHNLFIEV
jgi:N-methylhydantoinase A/oxoprolinase/acetone carboxylase beta subunit